MTMTFDIDFIAEWYDGLIQGIVVSDGRNFYAFCVDVDFNDPTRERRYWVAPITDDEAQHLRELTSTNEAQKISRYLRSKFLTRNGTILEGEPEAWEWDTSEHTIPGITYGRFIHASSVTALANR